MRWRSSASRQRHQQRIGPGIVAAVGLHRQMQHQLVATRPRRARLLAQVLGIGQERHGERARQLPGALRARPVDADIVDHDRDQRPAVEVAERHGVAAPGLASLRLRRRRRAAAAWRRAASPPASARGWPGSTSVYLGRPGMSSMRAYFGPAGSAGVPRFISSSVSRASRSRSPRFESLGQPVAAEQAGGEQQQQAGDDGVPAMGGEPCDNSVKSPTAAGHAMPEPASDSFCSPSRFCSSSTPSEHSALTPWPAAFILPQFRAADKTKLQLPKRLWASPRECRARPSVRSRARSPAAW